MLVAVPLTAGRAAGKARPCQGRSGVASCCGLGGSPGLPRCPKGSEKQQPVTYTTAVWRFPNPFRHEHLGLLNEAKPLTIWWAGGPWNPSLGNSGFPLPPERTSHLLPRGTPAAPLKPKFPSETSQDPGCGACGRARRWRALARLPVLVGACGRLATEPGLRVPDEAQPRKDLRTEQGCSEALPGAAGGQLGARAESAY